VLIRSRKRSLHISLSLKNNIFTLSTIEKLCVDGKIVKDPKDIAIFSDNLKKKIFIVQNVLSRYRLMESINNVKALSESDRLCCDGVFLMKINGLTAELDK